MVLYCPPISKFRPDSRIFIVSTIFIFIFIKQHPSAATAFLESEFGPWEGHLGQVVHDLLLSSSTELSHCSLLLVKLGPVENYDFDLNPLIHQLSTYNQNPMPNFHAILQKTVSSSNSTEESSPFFTKISNPGQSFVQKRIHGPYCSLVLGLIHSGNDGDVFYEKVVIGLPSLVKKNRDYFLFVGTGVPLVKTILASNTLGRKIKHRLGLVMDVSLQRYQLLEGRKESHNDIFTMYCDEEVSKPKDEDHEIGKVLAKALSFNPMRNMGGATLLISTPLSTRWLNEMAQSPKDGSWIPVRGPYKLVLDLLEMTLNFSASHFPSTGGGTGALVNGSVWIGTVGDVVHGRADLGHVTAETWARNRVVDHSFPISHEWLTFSTGEPQPFFSWRAIYRPLAQEVWSCIAISLGIGWGFFFLLMEILQSQKYSGTRIVPMNRWRLGILLGEFVLGTLLDQSPHNPGGGLKKSTKNSGALGPFTICWLMFSLLISTAYRSKLMTFLAFPSVEAPPDSFESLAQSDYQIGLQYIKGAAYQVFKHSKNPTYSKIFKRMSLESEDVTCFLAAVKSRFACISWDSIAEFVKHRNLTDRSGRSPVVKSPSSTLNINAGLVMEKRAVFKEEIDNILKWITDTGILIKIRALDFQYIRQERREWLRSIGGQRAVYDGDDGNGTAAPLSLAHFIGSFTIFGLCILLCSLCFWGEFLHFWRKKRLNFNNVVIQLRQVRNGVNAFHYPGLVLENKF